MKLLTKDECHEELIMLTEALTFLSSALYVTGDGRLNELNSIPYGLGYLLNLTAEKSSQIAESISVLNNEETAKI